MQKPSPYSVAGRELKCPHCGNNTFYTREIQLNTAVMEYFNLAWLNQSADNYICAQCGRIEWFLPMEE